MRARPTTCCLFRVRREAWDVDPQLLFGAETTKVPTSGAVCAHLEHEAKGADHLVLWLDCDREGENICFEVAPHRSPRPPPRPAPHRAAPRRAAPHRAAPRRAAPHRALHSPSTQLSRCARCRRQPRAGDAQVLPGDGGRTWAACVARALQRSERGGRPNPSTLAP